MLASGDRRRSRAPRWAALGGAAALVISAWLYWHLANGRVYGSTPVTIQNRTGQDVRVTLLTRNSAGKVHVLPQSVTGKRIPWQWRHPRDVEIPDGGSLTTWYHWSDMDLTWLAVRGEDGKLRALPHPAGPAPDPNTGGKYPPTGKPVELRELESIPLAPVRLL